MSSVQHAKFEDEALLAERSKQARETIEQLRHQLQQDLGAAINTQRAALIELDQPTRNAQALSQGLIELVMDLETRLLSLSSLAGPDGRDLDGRGR